ncbi:YlmC/YmxH family sporulation protein [Clostridium sp. DL1XJH146]
MYSLNCIKALEVINVLDGKKLGFISDIKIDCENFEIISIVLPYQQKAWFNKSAFIEIPWEKIIKIGIDVILVDLENDNYGLETSKIL